MGKRVLVVDDDATTTGPVAKYLRSLGHTVHAAAEAAEAGALISAGRYDAAILDLRLSSLGPGAEGLELLREIRERDAVATVIVLSAHVSAQARSEALRLGAQSVLQKPQLLPELARLALGLDAEPLAPPEGSGSGTKG